jgi:hypothetical protein
MTTQATHRLVSESSSGHGYGCPSSSRDVGHALSTPMAFIHIPKTGGTVLQERLRHRRTLLPCARAIAMAMGNHRLTARWAADQNRTALITLRDPYARIHSAYEYWAHGSKRNPRNSSAQPSPFKGVAGFLHALGDRHDPLHAKSRRIVAGRDSDHPAVWYVHFQRQTFWTDGFREGTIFVCYREGASDILRQVTRALACHNVTCDLSCQWPRMALNVVSRLTRGESSIVNPTSDKSKLPPYRSLSSSASSYFERVYRRDLELWRRTCQRPGPTCTSGRVASTMDDIGH